MAVDFSETDLDGQPPSQLRAKLEEALAANKALLEENSVFKARDVLQEKGFNLVKAEDLKGVALDKIEETAEKIQQDRKALQESLMREALERQGYAGEELDGALQEMLGDQQAKSEEAEATRRARAVGSVQATPTPRVDTSKLHGFDAIRHAVEQNANKRS